MPPSAGDPRAAAAGARAARALVARVRLVAATVRRRTRRGTDPLPATTGAVGGGEGSSSGCAYECAAPDDPEQDLAAPRKEAFA